MQTKSKLQGNYTLCWTGIEETSYHRVCAFGFSKREDEVSGTFGTGYYFTHFPHLGQHFQTKQLFQEQSTI